MSARGDLLTGIAQQLADAGIGVYSQAAYATTDTGITLKTVPAAPDRVIVLNVYTPGQTDNPTIPMTQYAVQVRVRGRANQPLDTDETLDAVYNLLHGQEARTYGTVTTTQTLRASSVPMGQDANKRYEHADNYYIDATLPPTANRPVNGLK